LPIVATPNSSSIQRSARRRHSLGTLAALFGVNPWRLQAWMGHKRIDETMLYVHVAEAHHRELPEVVRLAAMNESDPDTRILKMLGQPRGSRDDVEGRNRCRKRTMVIAENGRWRSPKTDDGDRRKRRWRSLVRPIVEGLAVSATA
jgi:hypothetical protein